MRPALGVLGPVRPWVSAMPEESVRTREPVWAVCRGTCEQGEDTQTRLPVSSTSSHGPGALPSCVAGERWPRLTEQHDGPTGKTGTANGAGIKGLDAEQPPTVLQMLGGLGDRSVRWGP